MERFPDIILLVGGFGTRLQSVVKDVPKPMALVAGKPFLAWIIAYLSTYNPTKIILSTGFMHETIESYFGNNFQGIHIQYSIETNPLGTGGAIKKAMAMVDTKDCLIMNGDSFFKLNLQAFLSFHKNNNSPFSMALKPLKNPSRYGTVRMEGNVVKNFYEKDNTVEQGLINTGVYLMAISQKVNLPMEETFSIETDFLEKSTDTIHIHGYIDDKYFIDIGIPEDYSRANHEFTSLFETE